MHIPKKSAATIDRTQLQEFVLTRSQQLKFDEGKKLFNEGKFWEAHEAWEEVWKEREEEGRIFFQGIIQAAAAYHLMFVRPRLSGARRNILKSLAILELFPAQYLNINVEALRSALGLSLKTIDEKSPTSRPHLDRSLQIQL